MDLLPAAARMLPEKCPFTVEQILDDEFVPD